MPLTRKRSWKWASRDCWREKGRNGSISEGYTGIETFDISPEESVRKEDASSS